MAKQIVRQQTDEFLNNQQETISYSPNYTVSFPEDSRLQVLSDIIEEPQLTGAISPMLPMYISIPDKDGYRLQFMMLINPENFNHGKTNAVYSNYTRKGYITQLWGPNQDILTANGKTAAFMVSGTGISNFFRKKSFAFLNFMSLMNAYKNNGYRIIDNTNKQSITRVVSVVPGVEISYDNQIMVGHFSNFTLDEDAEHPFLLNYNFEFVISTNNTDFQEVRGHFISQETYNANKTTTYTSRLLYDIQKFGPNIDINELAGTEPDTIISEWEEITGLPWEEALNSGLTNGTPEGNLSLLGILRQAYYENNAAEVSIEKLNQKKSEKQISF